MDNNFAIFDKDPTLYAKLPPKLVPVAKGPEFGLRLEHTLRAAAKGWEHIQPGGRVHVSTPSGSDQWHAFVEVTQDTQRGLELVEPRFAGRLLSVGIPIPTDPEVDVLGGMGRVLPEPAYTVVLLGRNLLGTFTASSSSLAESEPRIYVTAQGSDDLTIWRLLEMYFEAARG